MRRLSIVLLVSAILLTAVNSFSFKSDKTGIHLSNKLENSVQNKFTVWIYFTDKGENISNKLASPQNLVSQRSLERRMKVKSTQELVDYTDIPVYDNYENTVSNFAIRIRNRSKWLNAVSAEIDRSGIEKITGLNFVKKIELVETFKRENKNTEFNLSQPESYSSLPVTTENILIDSLNYGTGNAVTQMTQIKVNQVHNDGIFGQGILIASFDAGFSNLTHEVFTTYPMNIISTYDFHNHTPILTGHAHGTATLSLVGAYKPGQMISPAFKSKFILARTEVDPTENPAEMDNWIAAAEWADSIGADIITSSLGYLDFDPPNSGYTWTDMNGQTLPITNMADLAVNKGIIVCNSAGNNGSDIHNTLIGPADGDSVIT
nr:S8 family serine peptidase [Ignavibacteria bacterium]